MLKHRLSYQLIYRILPVLASMTLLLGVAPTASATPVVSITSPATNSTYLPPASITITASATDSASTIKKVDFYNGTTLLGTSTNAPYSFTWSNVATGKYTLKAKATNAANASTTSSTITVTVNTPPTVTVTSPVNNATYPGLATINLTSNVADSDGTIAKVAYYKGTTLIGTATAAPWSFSWTSVAVGTYSITAKATDNLGAVTTSNANTVTVTNPITVGMTAPGNNSYFKPASTITLSANATDTTGTISKVAFYKGSTLLGTVTAAPYNFSWASVAAGTYQIKAIATDSQSLTQTSSIITVYVDNPPTVTLTAPANNATYPGLANVTLTATATDSGGSVSKVEFYNGTNLIGSATASPYTAPWNNVVPGTYSITAKATDNQGAVTTTAANTITVTNPITTSITAPANNTTYGPNPSIAITATATDSKGTISKVDFYNGPTNIGTATSSPYTINWTTAPAGNATITAVATDSQGLTKTSAPITLTVHAAPIVSIQTPGNNSNAVAPATINLTANAVATGTTVTQVSYYYNGNFIGSASQAPYSVNWNTVQPGSYTLTAKVTDGFNDTTTSNPITITVAPNVPPAVSLTATPTNAMAPASITLTANATDSDGTIAQVNFYNGTTLLTTVTSAPYTTTWGNVSPGTYNLSATAIDNNGAATASSTVTVTITPAVVQAYYIQTDQINTPRQITDSSGNVVWQWENNDPYGVTPPNQNPTGQGTFTYNPRFPGQYFDKETNLHYNYYRDYDPATGRYLQSDPIGLGGGINTFAYVRGNPISRIDPNGLADLVYDNNTHTLTVRDGNGNVVGTYDAANNAQRSSRGAWETGTFDAAYSTTHPDDAPDSAYGSNGNLVFNVPGCVGCGVHSGRASSTDRAGRSGVNFATNGCIRTTDEATSLIRTLQQSGDPVRTLTVNR